MRPLSLIPAGAIVAVLTALSAAPASATPSKCVVLEDRHGNVITQVCVPLP